MVFSACNAGGAAALWLKCEHGWNVSVSDVTKRELTSNIDTVGRQD